MPAVLSDGRPMRVPEDVVYSVTYVMMAYLDRGRPIAEALKAGDAEIKRLQASLRGSEVLRASRAPTIDHDEDDIPRERRSPLNY